MWISKAIIILQLKLTLTWTNILLKYADLKSDENENMLTPEKINEIWMPSLMFTNTKNRQQANFRNESAYVTVKIREGKTNYI